MRKPFITTLIGGPVYFIVGWFVFEFILGKYTSGHTTNLPGFRKSEVESSIMLLFLSCMAYAALLSFILVFILNCKNLSQSFIYAAIIGVLVAIMADFYWYATTNFYSNVAVVIFDIMGAAISVGATGFVIAVVNRKLK